MKPRPLRQRLLVLIAAAILPLAAMAGVALFALARQQAAQAERAGVEIARALSTAVDAELSRAAAVLETLATATLLDAGDLRRFHELARRAAAMRPNWISILVHDLQGRIVVDTSREWGETPLPTAEPASLEAVLRERVPRVGSLAKGARAGYAFPVRVPVLRDGKLLCVITGVVRPDGILAVVNRQKLPGDWVVSVFDTRGQRVARSRQHEESLGGAPSPSLRRLMAGTAAEGSGVGDALEGDRVYTAYSRSAETGWTVAIGIPAGVVEAAAWGSLATYGGGILLSILLGAAAALFVGRSIAGPIAQLRTAAVALGRREPVAPPATAIEEIRQVADSLVTAADERARGDAEREQLLQREQQARAAAETANRAKDEFLAMLGHELRNPLGAISNATRLLEDPRTDAVAAAQAKAIVARQVGHLARMTDDLLDAARAMTGKIVLQRQPLELAETAAQVAGARKLAQRVLTRLQPVWISADPTRVEQLLGNLLANAVKYTPAGGTITVSVAREGADAVLRVADDGAGMPPELVGRVFEPFVQGERALDRSHGGLGIGLTLVRRLAELHGGSAAAHSDGPGRGSVFSVRLPAIATPASPAAAPPFAAAKRPRRVLVVEDNDDARETLRRLLELEGHRVRAARNGEEALRELGESAPEFALIDIGLPGMDGYELARRIRESGAPSKLVAVTGYGLPEDRMRSRAAGFDFHLVKPVNAAALTELLAQQA